MKKYTLLIIGVLLALFFFSSMSYEQQTIVPMLKERLKNQPFYDLLSKIELTYWGRTISVETRGYYYFVEFLIRKGIHIISFGCISIIFYIFYRKFKLKFALLYAVVTTFVIAALDEFRQSFVPGRTGVFDDVLLDTSGAILFVFLFKITLSLVRKIRRAKSVKV